MVVLHKGTTSSTPDISQLSSKELGINVVTGEIYLKTWDSDLEEFNLMRHKPLNSFIGLTYADGQLSANLNNTLTSNSTTEALTAAQGKVLDDKISALQISGKIYQVQSKTISTQGTQTLDNSDNQLGAGTDFQIDITPLADNSNFLIIFRGFIETQDGDNVVTNILRDTTRVNNTSSDSWVGLSMTLMSGGTSNFSQSPEMIYIQTVDTSGSTVGNTITYHAVLSASVTGNTVECWYNRSKDSVESGNEAGISEIIIMEIGA